MRSQCIDVHEVPCRGPGELGKGATRRQECVKRACHAKTHTYTDKPHVRSECRLPDKLGRDLPLHLHLQPQHVVVGLAREQDAPCVYTKMCVPILERESGRERERGVGSSIGLKYHLHGLQDRVGVRVCVPSCVRVCTTFPFISICSRSMSLLVLPGNRMLPTCVCACVCMFCVLYVCECV